MTTTVTLHRLDGDRAPIASATFDRAFPASWIWIQDTISREYDCTEDDVTCVETDGPDVVLVRGVHVASVSANYHVDSQRNS